MTAKAATASGVDNAEKVDSMNDIEAHLWVCISWPPNVCPYVRRPELLRFSVFGYVFGRIGLFYYWILGFELRAMIFLALRAIEGLLCCEE